MRKRNVVGAKRMGQVPRSALLALSASVLVLASAMAAKAGDGIETVVVTAPHYVPKSSNIGTKLGVPLIEVPQSISVINRDQISLLDEQNLGEAVRYTSGIVGEDFGTDERYDWLTLRGFQPIEYIDGLQAPIGSVSNVGVDLYGFQSVQVLKGPASTLYGSAPPGGIINLTSRRPQAKFGGELQVQYGSHDDKQLAGTVTGTLYGDDLIEGSFTALWRRRGTQITGETSNRVYLAPALTFNISPTTMLTLLSYYQYDDIRGGDGGFLPAYGVLLPNPLGKIPVSTNLGDTKYNDFRRSQYGIGYDLHHQFNNWLTFEQNLKFFYNHNRMLDVYGAGLLTGANGLPVDYRTVERYNFPFQEAITSFNVDSRLNADFNLGMIQNKALLGLDYRDYRDNSDYGFSLAPPIDLFHPVYGMAITTPPLMPYTREVQRQTGLYAEDQARYHSWILTLSGRQDWLTTKNYGRPSNDQAFTYRAGVNYLFDSGLAPYVSYATSFEPVAGADFAGHPFKPSTGDQVEAGVKFEPTFLPRNVQALATLAVYDINENNVLTTDPAHAFFSVQTGAAEVKGVELEGVTRINNQITINASYTYTDAQVTRSNGNDLGKRLPMVPLHKFSALGDYTLQRGVLAGFGGGIGIRYLSSSYGDPANQFRNPSVVLWDAILHYDFHPWRLQLNASNLFDKTYISRCTSISQCFYGTGRTLDLTLTRKF
jgi:iron complex outermembrane receptor protein